MGDDFRRLSSGGSRLFALADEISELALGAVIRDGPIERLTETRYAQPAVVSTSLAGFMALREQLKDEFTQPASFCAGHSVGEVSALVAAGALDPEEALRLVTVRSRLMAEACERVE